MTLFVAGQVVLTFERGVAYVANESAFQVVSDEVLFQQFPLRVGHLAFGTEEQGTAVQSRSDLDFSRFGTWLPLLRWLLLLFLLLLFGSTDASVGCGGSIDRTRTRGT